MLRAHTVEQVRTAEAALLARLPEGALMQRAAAGLAYAVLDLLGGGYGRRVLLLVGSGDNGGDALHAGAVLARRGVQVEAWLLSSSAHEGGVAALRGAGGRIGTPGPTGRLDVVVDGIVGIGGRPGLRPDAVAALAHVAGVPVVAVDTPSGVDVDTGEISGSHVTADLTVTFGTHKVCHLVDPAAQACGALQLVDIGLDLPEAPVEALQAADVAALLPRPAADAHKYTRGVVGVRSGSAAYPGAALLSVAGAACGLAGMVRYDGDPAALDLVRAAHPEVVGPGRVQAWVVGSGSDDGAEDALRAAVADGVPIVVDADALAFARLTRGRPAVLTPHAGELARLLGVERADVEARWLEHARRAAREHDAVVLLKGRHTVVARPDGRARVTTTGTPWLATAGAGDVLGGLVGALLATGLDPFDAASVGSWLHGAAATLAAQDGPIVASDVAAALPDLLATLTTR
ncbi:NAD(P)H-hydrate dehydratase [Pimelobacter simplex]|uniref:Bifunctional NAD(P)H-hydrate repair enzyme n=1 Tax=Nocardioides simplex TaxID=2045 RepID=A0A0A1DGX5_NOCSI|nr:NAD(P)H-hydrate dehydratase [Pimelobacter simplex]AIY16524.1 NAD(P)HX epimerase [Pimelobacter simplex]MCG8154292.1 NAD(P)H-hydrate dehydratase [Pimelobacter simplex]GEB11738.1 bifunctional NAD(P)H-hydrate repair enzyme [Pimelobacter simplex]SFN01064.1 yjeF C-terminal region, hydroxyethylthiazole kinase-related/yjeF N-terminal region [Pimelobacter simplex]